MLNKKINFFLLLLLGPSLCFAIGLEATEYTQLLNHEALIDAIGKLSSLILDEHQIKKTLANQYQLYLKKMDNQNFEKIAHNDILLLDLMKEIEELKKNSQSYREMLNRRFNERRNLQLNEKKYFEEEINLSKQFGGLYAQEINRDVHIIESLTKKVASFQSTIGEIEKITGPIQGLQLLNTQLLVLSHHMANLQTLMVRQHIEKNEEMAKQNQMENYDRNIIKQIVEVQKSREERDNTLRHQIIHASWNSTVKVYDND